jgi:hypothetical protein
MDIAGKVSGELGQRAASLRTSATGLGDIYSGEIEAASFQPEEGLVERAAEAPSEFAKTPEDVQSFQDYWNAQYQGPTEFTGREDYQQLSSDISEKTRLAEGVETEAGRTDLLASLYPKSTRGMLSLDQLLIGQTPEARGVLTEAAAPYSELDEYLSGISASAEEQAAQAGAGAEELRTGTRERFLGEGGVIPTFEAGLQERLTSERESQSAQSEAAIRDLLDYGDFDPASAEYLGIPYAEEEFPQYLSDLDILQQHYGSQFKIEDYLTQYTPEGRIPGIETLATEEDWARQAGLKTLLGEEYQRPLLEEYRPEGGEIPDTRLASFRGREAAMETATAREQADLALIETGTGGVRDLPREQSEFPDVVYSDDPKVHNFYEAMQRMEGQFTPTDTMKRFKEIYEQQFGITEPTPTEPEDLAPWETGQDRTRTVEGVQKWWDGEQWTDAPEQVIFFDADGNRITEKDTKYVDENAYRQDTFNPETGEYETTWEKTQDDPDELPPGIIRYQPIDLD